MMNPIYIISLVLGREIAKILSTCKQ